MALSILAIFQGLVVIPSIYEVTDNPFGLAMGRAPVGWLRRISGRCRTVYSALIKK